MDLETCNALGIYDTMLVVKMCQDMKFENDVAHVNTREYQKW